MQVRPHACSRLLTTSLVIVLVGSIVAGCASSGSSSRPPVTTPTATTPAAPMKLATVTLENGTLAGKIPATFAGFSIEPQYLCQFLSAEQQNPTVDRLYRAMGPSIIRLGGNTMDDSTWQPNAQCSNLTFGISTVLDMFAFAQRVNAQIIWGLNIKANDPRAAADEAATVAVVGGDRLLGFEIGNEPNNWTTEATYLQRWDAYAAAITAAVPGAPLTGPGMFDYEGTSWFADFVASRHSRLSRVTYHFYALRSNVSADDALAPSIDHLLSPQLMSRAAVDVRRVVRQARAYGLPLEIEESNSVNGGGTVGISNVFASTLWATDYLFTVAEQGASALNFHVNGDGAYAPIARDATTNAYYARPLYYAMLLYHFTTRDGATPLRTQTSATSVNLAAHALMSSKSQLQIVLVNKDQTTDAKTHVVLGTYGRTFQHARAMRLTAATLTSTTDISLAGASVDQNGNWAPRSSELVGVANASFTITVPHGSAVLVTLTS